MSQPIQAPRGTRDIFGDEKLRFDTIVSLATATADTAGFRPISTPTFEHIELFQRSIGEGTDVIDKELFTIANRKEDAAKYALRPEGTAGIVRAFIEHGVQSFGTMPVKLTSIVNNFRYDRPQAGRYREHTQWDLEIFCTKDNAIRELAYIALTNWCLFEKLELHDVTLVVNNLGSVDEQEDYTAALQTFLRANLSKLTEDSQRRTEVNPMRVLDSKDASDQLVLKNAPKLEDFTKKDSVDAFALFVELLTAYRIPYTIDANLVRGLDYYEGPVFEWVGSSKGQQSSFGGGGRYDRLLNQLGSKNEYGAVGSGIGIDRLLLELEKMDVAVLEQSPRLGVILLGGSEKENAKLVQRILSSSPYACDFAVCRNNLSKEIEKATRNKATHVLIIGEDERSNETCILRNLESGEQMIISQDQFENGLPELVML